MKEDDTKKGNDENASFHSSRRGFLRGFAVAGAGLNPGAADLQCSRYYP